MLAFTMGKLKKIDLQNIKYVPKELSSFWRSYFSHLTLDLNHLFTHYTNQPISLRYLHREVFMLKEYLNHTSQTAIVQPFKIKPFNEVGFVYLTGELVDYLIHYMLGGHPNQENSNVHYLTNFDEKMMQDILGNIVTMVEKNLSKKNSELELELMEPVKIRLMETNFQGEVLISVQQFLVMTGQSTHVFDLAFSNKFLEQYALL